MGQSGVRVDGLLDNVSLDTFLECHSKWIWFDLISEMLGLPSAAPKLVFEEVRRLKAFCAVGVGPMVLPVGATPPGADRAFSGGE